MRTYLVKLTEFVRHRIVTTPGRLKNRAVIGVSHGGDAQFDIDDIAEAAVKEFIRAQGVSVALFSEDSPLEVFGANPRHTLVVDPIDGTRPAAASLEMATISAAAFPFGTDLTLGEATAATVRELKSGAVFSATAEKTGIHMDGMELTSPRLSSTRDASRMFWSFELNGHPMTLMSKVLHALVDASANTGGVFVFNSATFSIAKIITGQLDAYLDIGNRVLRDHPATKTAFLKVGNGSILHLFPYDLAAINLIAKKAGVCITDAYGQTIDDMLALDCSAANQRSCVAVSNAKLHDLLLEMIAKRIKGLAGSVNDVDERFNVQAPTSAAI